MPTFMDVHSGFFGVTEEQLRETHERDLAIEGEEGVHFERAWLDPEQSKVFCLSTGPSRDSIQRVHERAGHPAAEGEWRARGRSWEGSWARLDLARCAVRGRRTAEATALAGAVRAEAAAAGSPPLVAAADEVLRPGRGLRRAEPWSPLTAREFDVARLVADGLTNRE